MTTKTATKPKKAEKVNAIVVPDSDEVQAEYLPTVASAKLLVVTNKQEDEIAKSMLQAIAVAEKRVKDIFATPKKAAHEAHKAITAAESSLLLPLSQVRLEVTNKILIFQRDERIKAEAEAKRLAELARKEEEDRKLQEAIDADNAGDKEGATAILNEEITTPAIRVEPDVAKVAGVGARVYYRCRLVNLLELVKYVAANPMEICLLEANETALRQRAESMKEGFKLPGCELDRKEGLSIKV